MSDNSDLNDIIRKVNLNKYQFRSRFLEENSHK